MSLCKPLSLLLMLCQRWPPWRGLGLRGLAALTSSPLLSLTGLRAQQLCQMPTRGCAQVSVALDKGPLRTNVWSGPPVCFSSAVSVGRPQALQADAGRYCRGRVAGGLGCLPPVAFACCQESARNVLLSASETRGICGGGGGVPSGAPPVAGEGTQRFTVLATAPTFSDRGSFGEEVEGQGRPSRPHPCRDG